MRARAIYSRRSAPGLIEVRARYRLGLFSGGKRKRDGGPNLWIEEGETFYTDHDGLCDLSDRRLIEVARD